ncbi:ubiquitin binding protein [Conidiobolus coronatus NRRL 28638]|uniref:Vacuolar protein sorting-associated protein 27 n=1 Tax=Conidiobolus coronatus (strain ATCC 28846 / CBS 209.66 / NRRL 28638) TaxID=796925 RepID=A0A137P8N0_CONC2|nr:ubiquitin binding protein [Conidiobolus coronatus NRRL 28638]|eukprot:KXN71365.1 ubiquitin binding protein [Conidiobolus coronatus NRRL 28638]
MFSLWNPTSANNTNFDYLVISATGENLPKDAEVWGPSLEACDMIRAKSIPAKEAGKILRKRLNHANPNVQILTLKLTDVCVKNGGNHFLQEVASREFLDDLVSILKNPSGINPEVKDKILELIQNWAHSTQGKPDLAYLGQTYANLKAANYIFPASPTAASAMVDTASAPDWTDSDVCMRCRTAFTFTNRKHHCRNCGSTFCQACSSNNLPLPHLGINDSVRVCTDCYLKLKKVTRTNEPPYASLIPPPTTTTTTGSANASTRTREDEDIEKAIQLSLQDSSNKRERELSHKVTFAEYITETAAHDRTEDADLEAAIAASLKDLEIKSPKSQSKLYPSLQDSSNYQYNQNYSEPEKTSQYSQTAQDEYKLQDKEIESLEMFCNMVDKMKLNPQAPIDPTARYLYYDMSKTALKLNDELRELIFKHKNFIEVQTKLSSAVKKYDQLLEHSLNPYGAPSMYDSYVPSTTSPHQRQGSISEQPYSAYTASYYPTQSLSYGHQPISAAYATDPSTNPQHNPVSSPTSSLHQAPPATDYAYNYAAPTQAHATDLSASSGHPTSAYAPQSAGATPAAQATSYYQPTNPQQAPQASQQPYYQPANPTQAPTSGQQPYYYPPQGQAYTGAQQSYPSQPPTSSEPPKPEAPLIEL